MVFSVERLRQLREADEDERCDRLLADCVALSNLEPLDKPAWDPPGIEEKQTELEGARFLLSDVLEHQEAYDWDEARVWKELYLHTFEDIKNLDGHNVEIDSLNAQAKRLQTDLDR